MRHVEAPQCTTGAVRCRAQPVGVAEALREEQQAIEERVVRRGVDGRDVGRRIVAVQCEDSRVGMAHADRPAMTRAIDPLGADVLTDAARAGVDHEGDLTAAHAPRERLRGVVDLLDDLHLEEVIAAAERRKARIAQPLATRVDE